MIRKLLQEYENWGLKMDLETKLCTWVVGKTQYLEGQKGYEEFK